MAMRCVLGAAVVCVAGAAAVVHGGEVTVCSTPMAAIADAAPGSPVVVVLDAMVPSGATVTDVRVSLDVGHDWVGDLVATVEHEGVVVALLDQIAGSTYPFGCGGNDLDLTFDDAALVAVGSLCEPTAVPNVDVSGVVMPAMALSAFDGSAGGGRCGLRM